MTADPISRAAALYLCGFVSYEGDADELRNAIRALPAVAPTGAVQVEIKPLEWVYGKAECEVGIYLVDSGWADRVGGKRWWAWIKWDGDGDADPFLAWQYGERHETEEAAEAAAQADYEARIRSALVVTPASDTVDIDLRAIMMEEIEKAAAASPWVPPEYTMNEVVSDCCTFLREGYTPVTVAKPETPCFWPSCGHTAKWQCQYSSGVTDNHDANARADRAEVERAAQIEVNAMACSAWGTLSPADMDDGVKWQFDLPDQIAAAIRNQPHDRTALDAAIWAAKVEAWKEAAALMDLAAANCRAQYTYPPKTKEQRDYMTGAIVHGNAATAILALIDKDAEPTEDAHMPHGFTSDAKTCVYKPPGETVISVDIGGKKIDADQPK